MKLLSRLFRTRAEKQQEAERWSLTPFQARLRAAWVVRSAAKLGVELDYTPESLANVDFLIDKERQTSVGLTKEMKLVLLSLGAYVGEVMIRHLGARWARGADPTSQDPLVLVVGGRYAVNVVSITFRRFLAGDPHSLAKAFEETQKLREQGI